MPNSRRTISVFAVAVIAMLSALAPRGASAAGCAGMSHELVLSDGAVSPVTGKAGATFTFTVVYADNGGCAPDSIVVRIEGHGPLDMGYVGGGLASGATFRAKIKLPAGRLSYTFEATSGSGIGLRTAKLAKVDPTEVVVSAPAPKPTAPPPPPPTPGATPADPAPAPTPSPTHTARPSHPPSPGASEPAPSSAASPAPAIAPAPIKPFRDHDDGSFGGPPVSPTIGIPARDVAPLPWLVLLVASLSAFFGLLFFGVLNSTFADPEPGDALTLLRDQAMRWPAIPRLRR